MTGSPRSRELARSLEDTVASLVTVIDQIDRERWDAIPGPGVWSLGKEVAHVVEAMGLHQWVVRRTIGDDSPSRPPEVERAELTTALRPPELAEAMLQRTAESASLIRGLSAEQLALPTRPPRSRGQVLEETIERVLIGHVARHRKDIEAKSRRRPG